MLAAIIGSTTLGETWTQPFRTLTSHMSLSEAGTFDALRSVSGIAVMAPNAAISMGGSSGGNIKGSVIGKTYDWSGASDLQVDQGTIMTMSPAAFQISAATLAQPKT